MPALMDSIDMLTGSLRITAGRPVLVEHREGQSLGPPTVVFGAIRLAGVQGSGSSKDAAAK